ncbi:hypothetical protein ACM0JF_01010 [Mycoplasma sp. 654]|uniref:hypothetical protein n=1 Tax=Mycoplasma sp. 654 TaxID=3398773 RepID=UPI003A8879AA
MATYLSPPPKFTEEKLKEILHYTDSPDNPSYEAFKSKEFFEIQSGAKGVSKSFGGAIITIYRLVNEINFNSMWCRNQYNHIKNTLVPMFKKVIDFLAKEHSLDYSPYINITNDAIYWNYNDGGEGRKIFFQNFEKIQAFQGVTLQNSNFYFGELVLDEPIEDPENKNWSPSDLRDLYKNQAENLPILMQNTVLRTVVPDNIQLKVKFFYNIFTTDHFLITDYHNKVINFINDNGTTNEQIMNSLVKNKYLQKTNSDFSGGMGIICTMFTKYFVPSSQMSLIQKKQLEILKEQNYRLWVITVVGFAFVSDTKQNSFYLRDLIYENGNSYSKNIEFITDLDFLNLLDNGKILGVFDGYDPGKSDNASWCRVALAEDGSIIVLNAIEDLKTLFKNKPTRVQVNSALIDLISKDDKQIFQFLANSKIQNDYFSTDNFINPILTDNDHVVDYINLDIKNRSLENQGIKLICRLANRKDTKFQKFGIESRQKWTEWILGNKLLKVIDKNSTTKLLFNLSKEYIEPGEKKRDESVFAEIYDLINAFEMACSLIYQKQPILLARKNQNETE